MSTEDNVFVWSPKSGFSRTARLPKGNADKVLVAYEVVHTEPPAP